MPDLVPNVNANLLNESHLLRATSDRVLPNIAGQKPSPGASRPVECTILGSTCMQRSLLKSEREKPQRGRTNQHTHMRSQMACSQSAVTTMQWTIPMQRHDISTGTALQIAPQLLLTRDDQRTPAIHLSSPPLHRHRQQLHRRAHQCTIGNGWLVAWGLCGCMRIHFSTVWLLPFTLL